MNPIVRFSIVVIAAAAFVVAAATCLRWLSNRPEAVSPREQEVMEAAISQAPDVSAEESHLLHEAPITSALWIGGRADDVVADELRTQAKRTADAAFQEALEDFIAKNRAAGNLRFTRPLTPNTQLVTAAMRERFGRGNGGNYHGALLQQFPGAAGITSVSRAGLDRAGTTAIIAVSHYTSPMSGAGAIYVFRRVAGAWLLQPQSIGSSWMS